MFLSLAVFCSLFYLIPGSRSWAPAKRVSASDIDPLSRLNYTVSGNSTYTFLSAASPGFFLDLQVPRHTTLVRVYGHKRAGAALYGVQLVYDGGGLEVVDGHDPSIPALLDDQPSCIFSLSIDPKKNLSLELYNLYDRKFRQYGTITFSFAEYIPWDKASEVHAHLCRHHIDSFSSNASALLPRDGNTSTPQPRSIDEKSNTIIGLLTALIVIVLAIFIVVTIYVLRIRRQAVLHRAERDSEIKFGESRNRLLDITLASATATETLQPRSQDQMYKDQYFQKPRSAVYTHPTPVPSVIELTQQNTTSRQQPRNDPPTSPPKAPIPELPKVPFPPPALQAVKNTGEILREFPTPPTTQHPRSTRIQDGTATSATTPGHPTSLTTNVLSPLRLAEPAQIRNPDNSMSPDVSFRPQNYPRSRFSKPLPALHLELEPLSLSPISHAIVQATQSGGSTSDPPGYIDICKPQSRIHDEVSTVREPSTTHMPAFEGSNQIPSNPAHKYTRSLDTGAHSLPHNTSKPSLEYSATITACGRRDTANSPDQPGPMRHTQSNQHNGHTRPIQKCTQPDNTVKKASLSFPLSDDPEEFLRFLQEQEESVVTVKNPDIIQTEAPQVLPLRVSEAERRARRSTRVEVNQQRASRNKPITTMTQNHEATSSLEQNPPTQVHIPRRALPKPPF